MSIGENIKSRRKALGLTQVQLANMIGESKQTLYKYENNIVKNIPLEKVLLLCSALHVDFDSLVGSKPGILELVASDHKMEGAERFEMEQRIRRSLQGDKINAKTFQDAIDFYLGGESQKNKPPVQMDEELLDEKLVKMLLDLSPEEVQEVLQFVEFLKAKRKA